MIKDDLSWIGKDWSFGGSVPSFFQDHARRNIPGYLSAHDNVEALISAQVEGKSNATIIDFGCSDGRLLNRLSEQLPRDSVRLVGIDKEPEMVAQACKLSISTNVEFFVGDARDCVQQHDIGICMFTLQFVPRAERLQLLSRIRTNLSPDGLFFLFEKVVPESDAIKKLSEDKLHNWKLSQGYSREEILHKAQALESVMIPISEAENRELLVSAGFSDVNTVWAHAPFIGWLAKA